MAQYTKDNVLSMVKKGESLERADLREIDLQGVALAELNAARADFTGALLSKGDFRGANLESASLRDAQLAHANLEGANLRNADLEGANLTGANLKGADLTRTNLEAAKLEQANLSGANLRSAVLLEANLGKADLSKVKMRDAEAEEAYLGGAIFRDADLKKFAAESANFEEADLRGTNLSRSNLRDSILERVRALKTNFEEAVLEGVNFNGADLTEADLRRAVLRDATFDGTVLQAAKLWRAECSPEQFENAKGEWADMSRKGDGSERRPVDQLATPEAWSEAPAAPAEREGVRYFGREDVLRNADLEFGSESEVHIEGQFEDCTIQLSESAKLVIGKGGLVKECDVVGPGTIVVEGRLIQGDAKAIVEPHQLFVKSGGTVEGTVQQPDDHTEFGFEHGSILRLQIVAPRKSSK